EVRDLAAGDQGQLVDWCLELTTAARTDVPVLVSQLSANQESSGVLLSWQVPVGIQGSFQLARSVNSGAYQVRSGEPLVPAGGKVSFLDDTNGLQSGSTLRYRIDWTDEMGRVESGVAELTLALAPTPVARFLLAQNYPNPFNPRTTISFSQSREERTSLKIYDSSGRLVASLRDELMPAGEHSVVWDGKDASGRQVSAGTYFYVLRSGSRQLSKAMVLLK
ncbi:MAG TPA: FlgD immunoglobulin-like domain containing protein, partial [Candidatus Krumholzibacteria bacterium]|nr:FlgD immunoglobulin-like domain containing protein [Candidatus Krumholzibacteria bacterium]